MLIELMKVTGRKFAWAYAALFSLWSLAALAKLDSAGFQISFAALVGAVMAANYGENRENARAGKEVKPDATTPQP